MFRSSRFIPTRRTPRRFALESLEPRLVLDSTVVFNEIMYNPPGATDATQEWIELHNQMAVDMDISDWSIQGGINFQFPEDTILPGRSFLVVAIDPTTLEATSGLSGVMGPFTGQLSNGGEQLRLVSNNGRVMNLVDYKDADPWTVGPDGSGTTLAKLVEHHASDKPANWAFSAQIGGTPGAINFPDRSGQEPPSVVVDLIRAGDSAQVLIPAQQSDLVFAGKLWNETNFNAAAAGWSDASIGLGFDTSGTSPVTPFVSTTGDLQAEMSGQNATALVRVPFQVADPGALDELRLRINYNDGYVAYLNGTEISRSNAPAGTLPFNASADAIAPASYVETVLADDPVAYFRFEENPSTGTAVDSADQVGAQSGSQNGSYLGDVTSVTGALPGEVYV